MCINGRIEAIPYRHPIRVEGTGPEVRAGTTPFEGLRVMTKVTSAAAKSNRAKPAARAFGPSKYEIPKWDLPRMEIPEALRENAEKRIAQDKYTCEKAKLAAEQATDLLKDPYDSAATVATAYNLKTIEFACHTTYTAC